MKIDWVWFAEEMVSILKSLAGDFSRCAISTGFRRQRREHFPRDGIQLSSISCYQYYYHHYFTSFFFCCLLYSYFSVGLSRVYSFFLRYCLACTVRFSTRSKAEWIVPFHCDGQLMENVSQDERYELLFANNQSSSFSLTKCIIWWLWLDTEARPR